MGTKDTLINVGLLAAGGVAIAAASGVYGKGSRNEDSRFREILKDKPELPKGEILDVRCNLVGEDVYARIRGKGWFYLIRGAWAACPMGPPFASYPRDFVDPRRTKGSKGSRAARWVPDGDGFRRTDVHPGDEVEVLYVKGINMYRINMYLPYVKCAGHVLNFDAALPLARAKYEASQAYDTQRAYNDYIRRSRN